MEQRQARFSGNRYEILLRERNAQRSNAPPQSLQSSVILLGTCQDMCPEFERYERELHFDLSPFETLKTMPEEQLSSDGTSRDPPRIDHSRAVKKYHRAAAGNETPLAQDVRPLPILRRTMDYLIRKVLVTNCPWPPRLRKIDGKDDNGDFISFAEAHAFVRDRTRSIRQDMTLQHIRLEAECIRIHEECARFHIASGEILCEMEKSIFDSYQNKEQLYKILQSLMEFYDDLRAKENNNDNKERESEKQTISSSCEAEFRAYYILAHIREIQTVRDILSKLKRNLFDSPLIKYVIKLLTCRIRGDFYKFFNLIRKPNTGFPVQDYLLSCLSHFLFDETRKNATEMMTKAYIKSESFPINLIKEWFLFEDDEELQTFFQSLEMEVNFGSISFVVKSPKSPSQNTVTTMRRSDRVIGKLFLEKDISLEEIIYGGSFGKWQDKMEMMKGEGEKVFPLEITRIGKENKESPKAIIKDRQRLQLPYSTNAFTEAFPLVKSNQISTPDPSMITFSNNIGTGISPVIAVNNSPSSSLSSIVDQDSKSKYLMNLSLVISNSLVDAYLKYFCAKQIKFIYLAHRLCQDLMDKFVKFKMGQLARTCLDKYQENLALDALSLAFSEAIIDIECRVACEKIVGEVLVQKHRLHSSITLEQLSDIFNRQAQIPLSLEKNNNEQYAHESAKLETRHEKIREKISFSLFRKPNISSNNKLAVQKSHSPPFSRDSLSNGKNGDNNNNDDMNKKTR